MPAPSLASLCAQRAAMQAARARRAQQAASHTQPTTSTKEETNQTENGKRRREEEESEENQHANRYETVLTKRPRTDGVDAAVSNPTPLAAASAGIAHTDPPTTLISNIPPSSSSSSSLPLSLSALLSYESLRTRQSSHHARQIHTLLSKPTLRQTLHQRTFKQEWYDSDGNNIGVHEFCSAKFWNVCQQQRQQQQQQQQQRSEAGRRVSGIEECHAIHMKEIFKPGITNRALGECSYLAACSNRGCRYLHYEIDERDKQKVADKQIRPVAANLPPELQLSAITDANSTVETRPAEWIRCDIRSIDVSVLGQFGVIMMDPPWRINMNLPYETMSDEEMLDMKIAPLQTDGVCCLWVVTRALSLGRRCLSRWGYREVGEILWVKTDQLHRLKRMGRTGPWLNHSLEHAIIGVKGRLPPNRNIDCDVIVAQTRETSRKPDEIYGILERLSPGARRLEIFGRQHNTRPGWLTLGNQLDGIRIVDESTRKRINDVYGPNATEQHSIGPAPTTIATQNEE